ncbi:MAG: hypothetical protein LBP83_05945 [Dysgonamonadaceae bacterium]|jgi:hypothetical protein|nr:hypothetical protein [Dysgonamonadaceae bacterium]
MKQTGSNNIRRKINLALAISIVVICITSCATNYKVITIIRPNGSCIREIYAKGDSAFLSGDWSKNPYLFRMDSSWRITSLNTNNKTDSYNVKVSKTFNSSDEIAMTMPLNDDFRPLVVPVETFRKRFRWFYTYYSYKITYPTVAGKITVSIDEYLNKAEQKLWFQGDFSTYAGMNGIELKEEMETIEKQFWKWYARNIYETYWEAICDFEKLSGNNYPVTEIQSAKDTLFQLISDKIITDEEQLVIVGLYRELDNCFNTRYFSDLYKNNHQQIDSLVVKKSERFRNLIDNLYSKEIKYEIIVPGKITYTNAPVNRQDTLVWKVDALRFTADDYELIAESRTVHIEAFAVIFLLLGLSIYCKFKIKPKRSV